MRNVTIFNSEHELIFDEPYPDKKNGVTRYGKRTAWPQFGALGG